MKKQYFVALGLTIIVTLWMFVPRGERTSDDRYAAAENGTAEVTVFAEDASPDAVAAAGADFAVRATRLSVQNFTQTVSVRGRTQANRLVNVRAETSGRVIGTPAARGTYVNEGDILCELAPDNREAELQEAISRREQARLEYEGALDLQRRDLQSAVSVAQLKATYDSAIAAVGRAELALARTRIRAPFSGIVESRTIEVGDYLDMGGQCATLMDDQPMLLVGLVPEEDVGSLKEGSRVRARTLTGDHVQGTLRYIARAADNVARSFRIEVELDPIDRAVRQGLSTDIEIRAQDIQAHLVPPSSITLDDDGMIGVKLLNRDNVVEFHRVNIVGESTEIERPGFWVTGLPDDIVLITLGQEIVFDGQHVRANFDWSPL